MSSCKHLESMGFVLDDKIENRSITYFHPEMNKDGWPCIFSLILDTYTQKWGMHEYGIQDENHCCFGECAKEDAWDLFVDELEAQWQTWQDDKSCPF